MIMKMGVHFLSFMQASKVIFKATRALVISLLMTWMVFSLQERRSVKIQQ